MNWKRGNQSLSGDLARKCGIDQFCDRACAFIAVFDACEMIDSWWGSSSAESFFFTVRGEQCRIVML